MATGTKIGHGGMTQGNLTDIDTVQRNPLGYRVFDDNGNEYIYCAGVASVTAGAWCFYNSATAQAGFTVALPTANTAASGLLCVALAAVVASNWGWFQIYGLTPATTQIATDASADGKTLSNGASGANGRFVTGPTTTKNVFNAVCVGASASNAGTAFISYPFMFGTATI